MRTIRTQLRELSKIGGPLAPILRIPSGRTVSLAKTLGWMTMLLIASTCTGCLFGPPIEGIPEEDLWPPQIVVEQVYPLENTSAGYTKVLYGVECDVIVFRVRHVIDRNTSDTLHTRWFIDWDGPTGSQRPDDGFPFGGDSGQSELRTDGDSDLAELALTFPLRINQDITNNQIKDKHTITFVVGDRRFGDANASYIGTGFEEEGQYDIYQWHIEFAESGLCTDEVQQ